MLIALSPFQKHCQSIHTNKKKKQPRCNTNSVEMEVSSICEFKFIYCVHKNHNGELFNIISFLRVENIINLTFEVYSEILYYCT